MVRNLVAGFTIAVLLGACVLVVDDNGWPHSPHSAGARIVFLVLLIVLLILFVHWCPTVRHPRKAALGNPTDTPSSPAHIANDYEDVLRNYSRETVNLFVEILLDPPHVLDRIVETATMHADAPRLTIATHYAYRVRPSYEPGRAENNHTVKLPDKLLFPIIWPRRGALLDRLNVTDDSGKAVHTVSYNQVRGLLTYTLEYYITQLCAQFTEVPRQPWRRAERAQAVSYQRDVETLLFELSTVLCAPGPLHRADGLDQQRFRAALSILDGLPIDVRHKNAIRHFCEQYFARYLVVAVINKPTSSQLGLTYSYCVSIESATNYPLNQWRERFGLNPSVVDVAHNPLIFEVEAYHLEISAQPDQYVYDHHLELLDSHAHITQEDLKLEPGNPYVRVYHEEARPNAHLYVRRQVDYQVSPVNGGSDLSDSKSVVEFREIPPGALGGATAVACVSAIIITFFAITLLGFDQEKASPLAPLPAILLALPGFVTVLLGSWIELSRLRRASLTTYLAMFGTMLYSLVSALFYLYGSNRVLPTVFTLSPIFLDKWHVLNHPIRIRTDIGWIVLAIVAITHALFLLRQLFSESRYYHWCIRERLEKPIRR